jgi:hypothetical protein
VTGWGRGARRARAMRSSPPARAAPTTSDARRHRRPWPAGGSRCGSCAGRGASAIRRQCRAAWLGHDAAPARSGRRMPDDGAVGETPPWPRTAEAKARGGSWAGTASRCGAG